MAILKYTLLTIGLVFVLVMVLIGILSITRGATVRTVIAAGDKEGPPQVSDPLFPRSIELFTGTHIEPGNRVEILLNGEGTYRARSAQSRCRCTTHSRAQSRILLQNIFRKERVPESEYCSCSMHSDRSHSRKNG